MDSRKEWAKSRDEFVQAVEVPGFSEKPTDELNKMLEHTKPHNLESYYEKNGSYLVNSERAFYHYMKDVLQEKNIKLKDVYSFAGVTESYGSQILRMEKHTSNRDRIICFCVAGHFTWNETNRALKLYGMNELYAKDQRDACLIVAINNRKYNLCDIDDLLISHGFDKLSQDE